MGEPSRCGAILVVDDDAAARELLVAVLGGAGYEVAAFPSADAALAAAEERRPRLAIVDVCMPAVSGYELCRRLRELYGEGMPVLFLSGERVDAVDRTAGLLLGGDDYLVKPYSPDELVARVVSLLRRSGEPAAASPALTAREQSVLELLAEGLSRSEIARTLVISPKTVSAHLTRIYEKLGARGRVQALRTAYRSGILQPL